MSGYDVARLVRLWAGWLLMALAHQLARAGVRISGADAELVEPVRPQLQLVRRS